MRSLRRLAVTRAALAIACLFACLLAATAVARAGDASDAAPADASPEDAAVAEILRLHDERRGGAALRRCVELARSLPEAAVVHLTCGELQLELFVLDEAERSFARASELLPKSAYPLALHAFLLAGRGEDARASQLARTALELEADSIQAQAVLRILNERMLVRAGTPEPARDAPAHVAWEFMETAGRGHLPDAFAAHFDGETMRDSMRRAGIGEGGGSKRALREVGDGIVLVLRQGFAAYHGYRLTEAPEATGDTAQVTVQVYAEKKADLEQARQLAGILESDLRDEMIAPDIVEAYEHLEPEERRAFVDRASGGGGLVLANLRFDLRRRDGAWKVVEITASSDGGGPAQSFSTLLAQHRELARAIGKTPERRSSAYALGRSIGNVVVGLGLLAVIAWIIVGAVRRGR